MTKKWRRKDKDRGKQNKIPACYNNWESNDTIDGSDNKRLSRKKGVRGTIKYINTKVITRTKKFLNTRRTFFFSEELLK